MSETLGKILKKCELDFESELTVNFAATFKNGMKHEHDRLMPIVRELCAVVEEQQKAAEFSAVAVMNLYQPYKPVHKGLDPTFYQTLEYDHEVELTREAREVMEIIGVINTRLCRLADSEGG